ncbi:ankyrin repeat domain-containing protein [Aeoliella mucimassa]|uniref:Ankyrin repeats (3 copies) n=1 Tax=Aeoliella mucimassa TaxID=2527972 RepID=A0A518ARY8_9BACT|nr:ankyrin repeat domain-containing protein [Aeoliella mucimassa]QDU57493.1 Ankyrin repeats (3 copies) [Aeoliella mucimassa]
MEERPANHRQAVGFICHVGRKVTLAIVLCLVVIGGCNRSSTFWGQLGLRASDYFEGDADLALCKAIENSDLHAIDQAIANGADVNAIGKDGVTPLMWAFPDSSAEVFEKLLKLGADPNVLYTGESLQTRKLAFGQGKAVTHQVTIYGGKKFYLVFEHGGDGNLPAGPNKMGISGRPPIAMLTGVHSGESSEETIKRLQVLIDHGADMNPARYSDGFLPVEGQCYGHNFAVSLAMLKAGADPHRRNPLTDRDYFDVLNFASTGSNGKWINAEQAKELKVLLAWLHEQYPEESKRLKVDGSAAVFK